MRALFSKSVLFIKIAKENVDISPHTKAYSGYLLSKRRIFRLLIFNSYSIILKLDNNYASRQMRLDERVDDIENKLDFDEFNENERKIWAYL